MDLQELPTGMLSFLLQKAELAHLGPRLGQLALRGKPAIQTPNYIANTSRGVLPHVTPDNLQKHTAVQVVYFGLEDFIERSAQHAPISRSPVHSPKISRLSHFTGLSDQYLTILGPRRFPGTLPPRQNTHNSVAISTSVGFSDLNVQDYLEATSTLKPDLSVSVADIVGTATISKKRIEKSADRSHAWLRDTLERLRTNGTSQSSLLASIPPLEPEQQALYLSDLASEYHGQLSGLCLYDPESVACVPDSLNRLPRICLSDPKTPLQVLRAVSLGVDLITVPFVTTASEAGMCLTFEFPGHREAESRSGAKTPIGYDLWSLDNATEVLPLSPGCSCYTCTRHHRAYIHHLLQAGEMLAWNLLQLHNFNTIHKFFERIHGSLAEGRFEEDYSVFQDTYADELPKQTGAGPRIRGYQTKSVGHGEPKKNRKAYGRLEEQARKIEEAESNVATPTIDETSEVLQQQGFASRVD